MRVPSQAEIARALGVVRSRVTALKKRGMPVDSVDKAVAWHRMHIAQKAKPIGGDSVAATIRAVQRANALGKTVLSEMENDNFTIINEVRAAMRAVPDRYREMVELPKQVWECLIWHVIRQIPESERAGGLSPEECELMGRYWYAVAAGEPTPF